MRVDAAVVGMASRTPEIRMIKNLDEKRCTGCRICVDVCAEDVLRFDEERKKAHVAYPGDCLGCGACAWFCPQKCIEVTIERGRPEVMAY